MGPRSGGVAGRCCTYSLPKGSGSKNRGWCMVQSSGGKRVAADTYARERNRLCNAALAARSAPLTPACVCLSPLPPLPRTSACLRLSLPSPAPLPASASYLRLAPLPPLPRTSACLRLVSPPPPPAPPLTAAAPSAKKTALEHLFQPRPSSPTPHLGSTVAAVALVTQQLEQYIVRLCEGCRGGRLGG